MLLQPSCRKAGGFIATASSLALLFCSIGCDKQSSTGKGPAVLQKVRFVPAIEDEVVNYVDLVGRTAANTEVQVQARVSGFLLEKKFTDGQLVKKGEVLFKIDPEVYQAVHAQSSAEVKVREAQLELAKKTFARSEKLHAQSAISDEEFEQNEASVAEAEAQLEVAKANFQRTLLDVKDTDVISPLTGRVNRALVDPGNYVSGGFGIGTILTKILSDQPIKAVANVDENVRLRFMRDLRKMAGADFKETDKIEDKKMPCFLQLQDETGFPHEGIITFAETGINEETGTSRIEATFENRDGLLKAGMFVRLRVQSSNFYKAVLVPERAIGTDQATRFVYVINAENKIEQRQVTLGELKNNLRVISSGVSPGEKVVTAGLLLIRNGQEVESVIDGAGADAPPASVKATPAPDSAAPSDSTE
ncbi:efflux RND transporter periplasmic adaptor subunit [Roseimaritima multifibrata]|nr:efflux RND transporter periplasmic adaptor subunit [Roseimaritima multifibrata]